MRARFDILISPGFVLALTLLLVNDFVLKSAWPGFVTGKLSDFAGLWAFALFWAALLPRRVPAVYVLIAIAWVLWKSPASQPAIDSWNASLPLHIARVVDYGDLLALAALPASYAYFARIRDAAEAPPTLARRSAAGLILTASVFAFGATSSEYDAYDVEPRDGVYYFADEPQSVVSRLNALSLDYEGKTFDQYIDYRKSYWISVPSEFCGTHFDAEVEFLDRYRTGTKATLQRIELECERDSDDIEELQEIFEREIIEPLGGYATPREALAANPEFDSGGPVVSLTPRPTYDARARITYSEVADEVWYTFDESRFDLITRLNTLSLDAFARRFEPLLPRGSHTVYDLEMRSEVCAPSVTVSVLFRELPRERTQLVLQEVRYTCDSSGVRSRFKEEFERTIIEPLRAP